MKLNEKIAKKREELEVDAIQLAKKCGLTIDGYSDLEDDESEFYMVVTLSSLCILCRELNLDIYELFGLQKCNDDISNNIIKEKIESLGLDVSKISDEVGITEESIYMAMQDIGSVSEWVMDPIMDLAKAIQINVSCIIKMAIQ